MALLGELELEMETWLLVALPNSETRGALTLSLIKASIGSDGAVGERKSLPNLGSSIAFLALLCMLISSSPTVLCACLQYVCCAAVVK